MNLIVNYNLSKWKYVYIKAVFLCTSSFAKKKPVDFDGELKIGDVRYDNIT